jgi:hypothetical protein
LQQQLTLGKSKRAEVQLATSLLSIIFIAVDGGVQVIPPASTKRTLVAILAVARPDV